MHSIHFITCITLHYIALHYITLHYLHTYMHAYIHTCMHAYIHTYVHAYVHTYTHTCMHAYIHACMHAYVRTYIHTYTHTYMHTYIHIYVCMYVCIDCMCFYLGGLECPTWHFFMSPFVAGFGPATKACWTPLTPRTPLTCSRFQSLTRLRGPGR